MILLVLALSGCSGSKEAKATCEKAADKYEQCIGEILGPEGRKMVAEKRDIGACAGDDGTVEMYKTCLPQRSCDKFMDCIEDYALAHGP
jgi:hypothetical protein